MAEVRRGDIYLTSEGDGTQGNYQKQIRNIGLDTLPVQDITLGRTEIKNYYYHFYKYFSLYLLACLIDDLL